MVDIYFSGWAGNPLQERFFPASSANARSFWLQSLADEIKDPNARFLVVVDTDSTAEYPGNIVAFAKWVVPGAPPQPPVPDSVWPADGDPTLAGVFFQELVSMHEGNMEERPHWYLEIISTRREYQGKGAGSLLLDWGVQKADDDAVECYLDSTPEGKGLYLKFGFEEIETRRYFDDTYSHCYMLRKAKGPGNSTGK